MDGPRFDSLTRSLAGRPSRRGMLRALGAGLAAVAGLAAHGQADAAKGTGGGKPQGRCATGQTNCRGDCVNIQKDPNHCGACNTICPPDETCYQGACTVCEDPAAACGAQSCGSVETNCGTVHCTACADSGRTCLSNGTCATPCFLGAGCHEVCTCIGHFPAVGTVCGFGTATGATECGNDDDCPAGSFCAVVGDEGRCFLVCPL